MLIIIKNYVGGMSGYAGGVTTVIAIMLVSLSIQTTMMGILSRQIEGLRASKYGTKPQVKFRIHKSQKE